MANGSDERRMCHESAIATMRGNVVALRPSPGACASRMSRALTLATRSPALLNLPSGHASVTVIVQATHVLEVLGMVLRSTDGHRPTSALPGQAR